MEHTQPGTPPYDAEKTSYHDDGLVHGEPKAVCLLFFPT